MDLVALLLTAPLLAEARNLLTRPRGAAEACVAVPARGWDRPLEALSRFALVVRDADEPCAGHCVNSGERGKGAAVAEALRRLECPRIALFDSDVWAAPADAARLAALAGDDGVATSYRLVEGRGLLGAALAAASDVGFLLMAFRRFIWGGAVAGRREVLLAIYAGVEGALSDDMHATAAARRLGVPIRFAYLPLASEQPARSWRDAARWLARQFAMAYRYGGAAERAGLYATALWLLALLAHPPALAAYAAVAAARRLAVLGRLDPLYLPAVPLGLAMAAAAMLAAPLVKRAEWRGRHVEL